jgi:hypothetical protein
VVAFSALFLIADDLSLRQRCDARDAADPLQRVS